MDPDFLCDLAEQVNVQSVQNTHSQEQLRKKTDIFNDLLCNSEWNSYNMAADRIHSLLQFFKQLFRYKSLCIQHSNARHTLHRLLGNFHLLPGPLHCSMPLHLGVEKEGIGFGKPGGWQERERQRYYQNNQ